MLLLLLEINILGGRRFDEEIINIIDKKYKKAKGKGLENPLMDESLFTIAERIKKILSNKDKAIRDY